jgi:glycogen operon protein
VVDDSFFLAFSAHDEAIEFKLPPSEYAEAWQVVVDTLHGTGDDDPPVVKAGETVPVGPRALMVLQRMDS